MEVVDAIVSAPTKPNSQSPIQPLRIREVTVLESAADLSDGERQAWQNLTSAGG